MTSIIILDIIGLTLSTTFIVLFTISNNKFNKAKYPLIAAMTLLFSLALYNLLFEINTYINPKYLLIIAFPLLYVLYPVINIYLNLIVKKEQTVQINFKHFIVPLSVHLILLVSYFILGEHDFSVFANQRGIYEKQSSEATELLTLILFVIYYTQFTYYLLHFTKLKKSFQNIHKKLFEFSLVKYFIYGIIIYEIISISVLFLNQYIYLIEIIAIDLMILLLGIGGLKHAELLLGLQVSSNIKENEILNSDRKIKSKISEHKQKEIALEIKNIVKTEKLFLNPNLKISSFARKLHLPENELSIIINDTLGKNFSTFINEFRIDEACFLLAQSEAKISDISNDIGFFSRSAFSTIFKELKGQTPTEYRNSLQ